MTDDNEIPEDMVREHWPRVCTWVRRGDRHQPQGRRLDENAVAGEVFRQALELWRRMPPADRPARDKWAPWLSTITRYKVHEADRARRAQERVAGELQAHYVPERHQVDDPAELIVSQESLGHLHRCVQALPEPDRSLILLLWEDTTVADAARRLGITQGKAAMRLSRLRKYLRSGGGFVKPSEELVALRKAIGRGTQ